MTELSTGTIQVNSIEIECSKMYLYHPKTNLLGKDALEAAVGKDIFHEILILFPVCIAKIEPCKKGGGEESESTKESSNLIKALYCSCLSLEIRGHVYEPKTFLSKPINGDPAFSKKLLQYNKSVDEIEEAFKLSAQNLKALFHQSNQWRW
ncbi:hypothetical protein HN784_03850 [bacterium]|jgi:hypothetical protein|nr:hypothetical protein [bacterium]MBT4251131.1 hypothetical protein [bacterium]MBT4598077.1 hypothetical protein [bacterium]MBT6753420.1 hypothetical protein [bacterium]MBT7038133.1 hypothetical protein [bacterium]